MIRWKIAVFEFKRFLKWKQELAKHCCNVGDLYGHVGLATN